MTALSETQRALAERSEFVQWYLEDSEAPYPVSAYMATPEIKAAAERAVNRFADKTLLSDCANRNRPGLTVVS